MKWHMHDGGYKVRYPNGQEYTERFKNVCITDHSDFDKSQMFIWFRVWKETEKEDILKVELIRSSPERISREDVIKKVKDQLGLLSNVDLINTVMGVINSALK